MLKENECKWQVRYANNIPENPLECEFCIITRGIDLVRNGTDVAYVAWKNWVFDAWVGEYLCEVRALPFMKLTRDGMNAIPEVYMESLIEKLNMITDAWKAQFQAPYSDFEGPEHFERPLPLVWRVEDGILFLDDVWVAPIRYLRMDGLEQAAEWVNPVSMEIPLIDGSLDIIITKWMGEHAISSVERAIYGGKSNV